MSLQSYITDLKQQKEILLVSHAVLGFPSWELDEASIDAMVEAGVDIIELQIPFSEPQADGPFFTFANQDAVKKGVSTEQCLKFAEKVCKKHPNTAFVFMTYYNVLFKYGVNSFIKKSADIGIKGCIIPDLPIEYAQEYIKACKEYRIDPIFLFTPTTSKERMEKVGKYASGFIYCQARTGVTGKHTEFNAEVDEYIARVKGQTNLPLAFGFGIQKKEDIDFLKGKVDIAICCTQAVKILYEKGVNAMKEFLISLR